MHLARRVVGFADCYAILLDLRLEIAADGGGGDAEGCGDFFLGFAFGGEGLGGLFDGVAFGVALGADPADVVAFVVVAGEGETQEAVVGCRWSVVSSQ